MYEYQGGVYTDKANWLRVDGKAVNEQKLAVEGVKNQAILDIRNEFGSQRVTPEMLSESTKQLINASGGGTVTNLADDEDLASVGGVIKERDREAGVDLFVSKGRKVLRRNNVGGKNILTQAMINKPNTIYVIRYEFDLNGAELTPQPNCIFLFEGGAIKNGMFTSLPGIQGCANIAIQMQMTGEFGTAKADVKLHGYYKGDDVNYTQVRFSAKYNVAIDLAWRKNTAKRYSAAGNLKDDDTKSLQCLLDVQSFDGGDAILSSEKNGCATGYLVSSPLLVTAHNNPLQGYRDRPRLYRIISDYNCEYATKGCYLKGINIPDKRGVLELKAYGNGWPNSTSIYKLSIDASDNSNANLSFALRFEDGLTNVFQSCHFKGKNAVLDVSGFDSNSYSKIGISWRNCLFESVHKTRGWALSMGKYLHVGRFNGDNEHFIDCRFHGLMEIACATALLTNCMFSVKADKDKGSVVELGIDTADTKDRYVDFSACIQVLSCIHAVIDNCYFEDFRTAIMANVDKNEWNAIKGLKVCNCYINGYTNQKTINNGLAEYGILIGKHADITSLFNIENNIFRWADYGYQQEGFSQAIIDNQSTKACVVYKDMGGFYWRTNVDYNKIKGAIIMNDNNVSGHYIIESTSLYNNKIASFVSDNLCIIRKIKLVLHAIDDANVLVNNLFAGILINGKQVFLVDVDPRKCYDVNTKTINYVIDFIYGMNKRFDKIALHPGDKVEVNVNVANAGGKGKRMELFLE